MDHEARCPAHLDPADPSAGSTADRTADTAAGPSRADSDPADTAPIGEAPEVDWLTAQAELDECDGYVVLAVDPQTGEVDAHGPFRGLDALEAAESMRATLDREDLTDVVVRVVRWHQEAGHHVA